MFSSIAASHVLASTALLLLVDDGAVTLGTKVADVWPEFAANVCAMGGMMAMMVVMMMMMMMMAMMMLMMMMMMAMMMMMMMM